MDFIFDPSVVLYLPLYQLDGSSFTSKDAYGHLCTATDAALYPGRGRYFDSLDDEIDVPAHASLSNHFDGGGTIVLWINLASDGQINQGTFLAKSAGGGWYFLGREQGGGKVKLRFLYTFSGTNGVWTTTATALTLNTFSLVAVTYNSSMAGTKPIIYVDDAPPALSEDTASVGTRDDNSASQLTIGDNNGSTRSMDGIIGEVWFYSRIFTPLEIQNIRLETKWRYR